MASAAGGPNELATVLLRVWKQLSPPVGFHAIMSFKSTLREAAARLLFHSGLTAHGWRARGRLSIATFHRVLPDAQRRVYPFPGLVVTPEELGAILGYLAQHFEIGTLAVQH